MPDRTCALKINFILQLFKHKMMIFCYNLSIYAHTYICIKYVLFCANWKVFVNIMLIDVTTHHIFVTDVWLHKRLCQQHDVTLAISISDSEKHDSWFLQHSLLIMWTLKHDFCNINMCFWKHVHVILTSTVSEFTGNHVWFIQHCSVLLSNCRNTMPSHVCVSIIKKL